MNCQFQSSSRAPLRSIVSSHRVSIDPQPASRTDRSPGHRRSVLLTALVWLSAAIALLGVFIHIGAIFGGPTWFEFFGAPPVVVSSARAGTLLAPLGALTIAALMAVCGLFALSALGVVRRLPLLRPTLSLIACITLLRALSLVPVAILKPNLLNAFEVVASLVWGLAGIGFVAAFVGAPQRGADEAGMRRDTLLERARE
jgi:hypothetical protein